MKTKTKIIIIIAICLLLVTDVMMFFESEDALEGTSDTVYAYEETSEPSPTPEPEETPEKFSIRCEHEEGKVFSFQTQGSTAASDMRLYCKNCMQNIKVAIFRGTPKDLSYLDIIKEHIDGEEIVGGEYYTIKGIVAVADYNIPKTIIRCRLESGDTIVIFSVEFREEFEDAVGLLKEGDEVTFRGRFYDEGCGFTDSELITE